MAKRHLGLTLFFIFTLSLSAAHALPNLQIYLPDGTYNYENQSWVTDNPSFRLDVAGAVNGGNIPSATSAPQTTIIEDVKIALVVPTNENGTITISRWVNGVWGTPFVLDETPSLTENPSYYAMDNTTSLNPETNAAWKFGDHYFVTSGTPQLGDGENWPNSGALASGLKFPSSYYQFYLGDFGLGMKVPNYQPGTVDTLPNQYNGHIESLYITVNGYTTVDIITYNHVIYGNNQGYKWSPNSHDGGYAVPEPGTLVLLGLGLVGLFAVQRRRKHLS